MADKYLIAAAFSAMTGVEVRPSCYQPQSPDDVPAGTLSMYELFRSTYVMQPVELVFYGGDMEVHVMTLTGNRYTISVSSFTTIAHLKISVSAQAGVPPCEQRLIYNQKPLDDQQTIETAGIPNGATIYLVVTIRGGGVTWYLMDDSLMHPGYDYDFTHVNDAGRSFVRGGYPYRRPCGWRRFALKVLGQTKFYSDDNWIADGARGWPVTYHGTNLEGVKGITNEGFKIGPGMAFGPGVYSSPCIEMVGNVYSRTFQYNGKEHKVALQNRVNPDINGGRLQITPASKTATGKEYPNADYWCNPQQDNNKGVYDVRPYGILIREV